MLYNDTMQTKVGVHFHVRVGPDEVSLYDGEPLAGPYYDLIFSDLENAHKSIIGLIQLHLPEYLDDDEIEESYEYIEYILHEIEYGDLVNGHMGVDEFGLQFVLSVCTECVPKGMN